MTESTKPIDMSQGFTITRVLDAPRDLVWRAWTEPDEMARWFHPRGATTPREEVHVDLRVGGRYGYVMVSDETGERVSTGGAYLEITEPERLVFTWGYPDAAVEDSPVVTLAFADLGGRTEMTFRLQGAPGHAGDGFMHDGWTSTLDSLAENLAEPSPPRTPGAPHGAIRRMEHVGVVVDDLEAATAFFVDLGLELQGRGPVEGRWVDRVVGLEGVRAEVAVVQTPDGHGRLELTKFHTPADHGGSRDGAANAPGLRHVAFAVEDIDAVVSGLRARGTELVGDLERYEDSYRLCYVRGPEGIIVELTEQLA
ncbi:SRPBCC domain-containing protein [Streptomyces sp. TRM70308]|uniref:SRPBCC domain-containing protein n=1 Tax=Streptomyces sp. TRM70308 TaxID=3131932 RepID=UPI003CFDECDA